MFLGGHPLYITLCLSVCVSPENCAFLVSLKISGPPLSGKKSFSVHRVYYTQIDGLDHTVSMQKCIRFQYIGINMSEYD